MPFYQYTDKTAQETLELLKSSKNGLSKKEVGLALEKYGLNEIRGSRLGWGRILLRQFRSPFFYLLFVALIISTLIGEQVDSLVIFSFIFLNVAIGFFQEYKAEKSVSLLKKIIPHKARVMRDGKEQVIDKKFLVPGDIVFLEPGDIVPADLRVLEEQNFLTDESSITGESNPVSKVEEKFSVQEKEIYLAKNIIFTGTSVVAGRAAGIVVATGKETVFGEIASSISKDVKVSVYEKNITYFAKLVLKIVSVTIALIFVVNVLIKGFNGFFDFLLFCVALIVSILPEALPAVVTFSLSKGSIKLAKKNVVVKRLSAIEDLGNVEILCTDKTGTLTQNKLSLEKMISSDKDKCFLYAILSFNPGKDGILTQSDKKILNPFDYAIFQRSPEKLIKQSRRFGFISESIFDSFKMTSASFVESPDKERLLIMKGSPDAILKKCSKFSGGFTKRELREDIAKEGEFGKRVLAVAYKKMRKEKTVIEKEDESGLTFLGYFVFDDSIKNTAKDAIDLAKRLGVQIKMITGDSKEVAGYVGSHIGLAAGSSEVILQEELEAMSKDEFDYACKEKNIFARISPDMKHKIIKSLQKRYAVGFLGDGINDAPALKISDVGIAVAGASDIAKETADVVMLERDLRVIVNGIKDGRTIFLNINKYIKCALASNFGNFYSIAVISLFIDFLPMLPVQILLGNILSDFPLISIATDSVDVEELRRPKAYQISSAMPLIISLALVSTVFDFIFFAIVKNQAPQTIQTLWFVESIITEIMLIFVIRTRHEFWKARKPGFWLLAFAIIDLVFVIALPFLPIAEEWFHFIQPPLFYLLIVLALTIMYFCVSELVKQTYFRYWKPANCVVK